MNGKLIVVEGGDGCGKTSVINALKDNFPRNQFVFTREPGGTGSVVAENVRKLILDPTSKNADPDAIFHLFWASRVEHIKHVIWPAMKEGKIVVTDRFDASTYAYQIIGEVHNHLTDMFVSLRKQYVWPLKPSYIILDVDPRVGRERALKSRGVEINHFDQREIDFYTRVRAGYADFFRVFGSKGSHSVNANDPLDVVISMSVALVRELVR